MERTLILFKPDCVHRRLVGRVLGRFEDKGLNVIAMALWTLGVFASLYAGYLKPELRVTCSNLSSVINGVATILMFVFIDPQVSVMSDDVIEGRISDGRFRRAITSLLGARLAGTVLAQILLLPSAAVIMRIAEAI